MTGTSINHSKYTSNQNKQKNSNKFRPTYNIRYLVGPKLLIADIGASKLVARGLQGAHGKSVVHLEMVAQTFVHNELSALKGHRE